MKKPKRIAKHLTVSRSDLGLRFHLILFLVFFLIVAISVTWLFQMGLLDVIYENVREKDMDLIADELS